MKKKAFTLIELLVVIAIIALLMAILMPALRLARDQAKALLCVTNLRNLSIAWLTYAQDHKGKLVHGHIPRNNNPPRHYWVLAPQNASGGYTGDNRPGIVEDKLRGIKKGLLYPYVKNVKVYHCPGDARIDIPDQKAYRSYSMAGGMNGEAGAFGAVPHLLYDRIRSPGDKYVFVEEMDDRGWNMGSWVLNPHNRNRWVDPLAIWHNERSCLGFADGHAEKHRWLDERTIKMAEEQNFGETHPGSPDLAYMHNGYAYKKLK
jgi:prepilin-type N-terminal cleavage/methylation domain-containing protein